MHSQQMASIMPIVIGCINFLAYETIYREEPIGYPAQPGLIRPSYCLFIRMGLQIRYWAENGTGPTDSVNYSTKSWIHMNRESEILQNKVYKWE